LTVAVGGNRCGHDPAAPRFHLLQLPEDANTARPALIIKLATKIRAYYHTAREGRWDALSQGERQHRWTQRIHTVGGDKTLQDQTLCAQWKRWRQQRSERRESLVLVLALMVYYTDIVTLKVAIPHGNDWLGLSAPWIAQHCGLSLSRTKRALATLARSTLLVNTGRGRQFDKRRRCWVGTGWGPIRQFSFQLIRVLGLEVSWRQAQRKARKPANRTTDNPVRPSPVIAADTLTPPVLSLTEQRERAQRLRQQLQAPPSPSQVERVPWHGNQELSRQIAELALQGYSPAEIRKQLQEAAQPPDSS
jgi:hypothetical protein